MPETKGVNKKKAFIVGGIVVILLLNILWTVLQNKFTPKVDEVKAEQAKIEQRIAKLERGGLPDVADIREEFAKLRQLATQYEERTTQLVKAEEERLASLEAQVEAQKARIANLKKMIVSESETAAEPEVKAEAEAK